jgi:hypothetical protein
VADEKGVEGSGWALIGMGRELIREEVDGDWSDLNAPVVE